MLELIIKGGTIIDGTGVPGKMLDLGIQGDRIVAVENLDEAEASQIIDASGLVVAPGFIDMHSHGDTRLPFLPTADSKVHQGITLEVVGNCGSSMAPLSDIMVLELDEHLKEDKIADRVDWQTTAGFLDRLTRQGTSVNVAALVGHGTVREKVMGMSDAPPSREELAQMKAEVTSAIAEGAIGLSTGLIYTPNIYARTEEIIALAKSTAQAGGIYTSHIRGEGNTLLEALHEAIEVGRQAEIPVQISHLKASGVNNWHKMPAAIELLETARNEGLDITADMYPYPASNTGLTSLIPAWVHVGGREAMIARLSDALIREEIHSEVGDTITANGVGWEGIIIAHCPAHLDYDGRSIQDIAESRRQEPLEAVMDILIESNLNASIIMFTIKEENVALGLQYSQVMIGTDAGGAAAQGPFSTGKPHPRNYGTFPRVLGRYAREQKLFSLEEAVRKMTSLPASKLGLSERGKIQPGYFADVVIFNPATVIDTSTFSDPHQYPLGIEWVFVNGQAVISGGKHTGARPGCVVKSSL